MRFLIVDDDESVHLYLQSILTPYGVCDCAVSGEESVELYDTAFDEGTPYDTVFMDILMPGMDGHHAAQIMRAVENKRGVKRQEQFKLVMVTSLVDDTNVSKAFFNAEATCYIVKPLNKDKVLAELRQNLILP